MNQESSTRVIQYNQILVELSPQRTTWLEPGFVHLDPSGKLQKITADYDGNPDDICPAIAIPAFENHHSHAFQYLFRGLTESRLPSEDPQSQSFWTWRQAMYKTANKLNPDDVYVIAKKLYRELAYNGFSHVHEFHYLHHGEAGKPYNKPYQMAESLIQAAADAKIQLTMLPVLYQRSSFSEPIKQEQKRFCSPNIDAFDTIVSYCRKQSEQLPFLDWGIALHSPRAVKGGEAMPYLSSYPDCPVHIHISEQEADVAECLQHAGKRPLHWLAERVSLNERWHLIHATHFDAEELKLAAREKCQIVLCPSTEANLGDGIFPIDDYLTYRGCWRIGTDSHVGLNPFHEIQLLEYSGRLLRKRRNINLINGGNLLPENASDSADKSPIQGALTYLYQLFSQTNLHSIESAAPRPINPWKKQLEGGVFQAACLNPSILNDCLNIDHALAKSIYCDTPSPTLGSQIGNNFISRNQMAHQKQSPKFKEIITRIFG